MSLLDARMLAEQRTGARITDEEYERILEHSKRKLEIIHKDDDYLPLLLENEIRDYCSARAINMISLARREVKCAMFA